MQALDGDEPSVVGPPAWLPIVSTACPSGPREILDQGRAGILTELTDGAFARGLAAALDDRAAASARAQHGLAQVERYSAQAVAAEYLALCERIKR